MIGEEPARLRSFNTIGVLRFFYVLRLKSYPYISKESLYMIPLPFEYPENTRQNSPALARSFCFGIYLPERVEDLMAGGLNEKYGILDKLAKCCEIYRKIEGKEGKNSASVNSICGAIWFFFQGSPVCMGMGVVVSVFCRHFCIETVITVFSRMALQRHDLGYLRRGIA